MAITNHKSLQASRLKQNFGDHLALNKRKMDQLDNLLLFATSLVGYIFVVTQLFFRNTAITLFFLPLLVLGVVIPVWKGYIRGALRNSMQDRIMGWTYLIFGLGIYFWFTISFGLADFSRKLSDLLFYPVSGILLIILFYLGRHFSFFVSKKYKYQITNKDLLKAFQFILIIGVLYFGYSLVINQGILLLKLYSIINIGYLLSLAIFLLIIGISGLVSPYLLFSERRGSTKIPTTPATKIKKISGDKKQKQK